MSNIKAQGSHYIMQPGAPYRKFSKLCLIRGVLQWWSMRKYILKHTHLANTFDTKIILHNYILC